MSDQIDEEIIATKLDNGSMTTNQLLDFWLMKYNIPEWQIDYVKKELENGQKKREGSYNSKI